MNVETIQCNIKSGQGEGALPHAIQQQDKILCDVLPHGPWAVLLGKASGESSTIGSFQQLIERGFRPIQSRHHAVQVIHCPHTGPASLASDRVQDLITSVLAT